jgi:hypothetical protein
MLVTDSMLVDLYRLLPLESVEILLVLFPSFGDRFGARRAQNPVLIETRSVVFEPFR